jgi:hypothetical protein
VARAVFTITALACVLPVAAAHAQSDAARIIELRFAFMGAIDPAIAERIRGQTADLDGVTLVAIERGESVAPTDLAAALQLAREQRVELVIWAGMRADELRLWLLQPGQPRLLMRGFALGKGALDASSAREALALVVRDSLLAIRDGQPIGEPVQSSASTPERAGEPRSAPSAAGRQPPAPARSGPPPGAARALPSAANRGWSLDAGWFAAADGVSEPFQHGLELRVGLRSGFPELGVALQYGVGATVEDAATRLTLARHALLAELVLPLHERGAFDAGIGLRLGAVRFDRRTEATVAALEPENDARILGFAAGANARARLALVAAPSFAIGLSAQVRALALPAAPTLQYRWLGGTVARRVAWLELEGFLGLWGSFRGGASAR